MNERGATPLPAGLTPADAPWLRGSRPRHLPRAWPIYGCFLLLPLWWGLGLSGFVVSAAALPLLASLVFRRRIVTPRGFGIWLMFMIWVVVTATQVDGFRPAFALAYRGTIYVGSAALFLYVLNQPRDLLRTETIVKSMAGFWVVIVVGGMVGMLLPAFSFRTPAESLLPNQLLQDRFVSDLVSASTTTVRAFAAYPIHRPKAPFIYTNEWGATFALTLPFAIAALGMIRSRLRRDALALLLIASVFPLVFSLDRGAWLSAGGAMAYATFRLARGRNARLARTLAVASLAIGALMFLTPLGSVVMLRITHGYSDQGRLQLYADSIRLVRQSPIFGYGAPVAVERNVSAGTHGMLWTLVVSYGIPGLALFAGWFVLALYHSGRRIRAGPGLDAGARFWSHVVIFTALIQLPYYDLIPWGVPIAMLAAAVAWRETPRGEPARARARGRRPAMTGL